MLSWFRGYARGLEVCFTLLPQNVFSVQYVGEVRSHSPEWAERGKDIWGDTLYHGTIRLQVRTQKAVFDTSAQRRRYMIHMDNGN